MRIFTTLLAAASLLASTALTALPQNHLAQQNTVTPIAAGSGSTTQGVFTLAVTGACPGPVTLDVTGATPFAQVAIAWSPTTGSFTIPSGSCAGTILGLGSPRVLSILVADGNGTASLTATAPSAACGLYLQAVDFGNCSAGNIVQVGVVATSFDFPSAASAIVGSIGFIGPEEVGFFWDNLRGDSVSETVVGPTSITNYSLVLDITTNVVQPGSTVTWDMIINGTIVDSFIINPGDTLINRSASFGAIPGPNYALELKVTNQVPFGGGSCALRYAGIGNHAITVQ